jgi:hypothetical protein
VAIASAADPGGSIAGRIKSDAVIKFDCSITDFQTAQTANGTFVMAYAEGDIAGLAESLLTPWRYENGAWTQAGTSGVSIDVNQNRVSFQSRYPGTFVLASISDSGPGGPIPGMPVASGWGVAVLLGAITAYGRGRIRR